jgi:hypothetical protein
MIAGPPDLSGVVASFSMPVTIRNYDPDSTTTEGLIAAGAVTDTPSTGHYFPAKGKDIARLELQSPAAAYEIHLPERGTVRAVVKGSTDRASVVIFGDGTTHEVKGLGAWFSGADGTAGYQQAWIQEVKR